MSRKMSQLPRRNMSQRTVTTCPVSVRSVLVGCGRDMSSCCCCCCCCYSHAIIQVEIFFCSYCVGEQCGGGEANLNQEMMNEARLKKEKKGVSEWVKWVETVWMERGKGKGEEREKLQPRGLQTRRWKIQEMEDEEEEEEEEKEEKKEEQEENTSTLQRKT